MASDIASRYLTEEEREQERRDLVKDIKASLISSSPDTFVPQVKEKLQKLDLSPRGPQGIQFFSYIEELLVPLSASYERARDFAKNWKGRR